MPTERTNQDRDARPADLRDHDERYRSFVEQSSEGIWCFEAPHPVSVYLPESEQIETILREGVLVECNDAMARMYGFQHAADLLGSPLADLLVSTESENVEMLAAFIRSGYRLVDADTVEYDREGKPHYFLNNLVGIVRDGALVRAWGTQRDVTEQKRVENELRESEQRYRELFENANDIVYTHDLVGRFTSLNRAGERITGYSRDEVLAISIGDVVAPEDLAFARDMIARKVDGESETTYDLTIVSKDGRKVSLEVSTKLIRPQGQPPFVLGVARDVTERRRLEGQLFQSQKMEAVGRLAGGVAHDFNNLLTIINGYSDLLLRRLPQGDPLHVEVSHVRNAGERAATITRQLLSFSRKQPGRAAAVDLNHAVADVDGMLRRLIGEDVALDVRLDPALAPVLIDPAHVEQILLNLAVNARDAMPHGGALRISTEDVRVADVAHRRGELAPGRYARLVVEDTGDGMDEATCERIFEPFFTTKAEGTGLGLATVYNVVSQAGGLIEVESVLGIGTVFRLLLPTTAAAVAVVGAAPKRGADERGSGTVLVVEDEESVRQFVTTVLESCGYTVLCASNGEEALSVWDAAAEPIDLVLTDVVMPGMTGVDLADRLALRRPGVPVLLMSGYHENVSTRSAAGYISKPFAPQALTEKVRELLAR